MDMFDVLRPEIISRSARASVARACSDLCHRSCQSTNLLPLPVTWLHFTFYTLRYFYTLVVVLYGLWSEKERALYYAQNHQVSRVKKPWISGSNFSTPWRHSTLPITAILLHHNSHCGNLCWCFWSSHLLNLHCWLTLVPFKLPNKFRRTFSRVSFLTNWFHSGIRTLIISVLSWVQYVQNVCLILYKSVKTL